MIDHCPRQVDSTQEGIRMLVSQQVATRVEDLATQLHPESPPVMPLWVCGKEIGCKVTCVAHFVGAIDRGLHKLDLDRRGLGVAPLTMQGECEICFNRMCQRMGGTERV